MGSTGRLARDRVGFDFLVLHHLIDFYKMKKKYGVYRKSWAKYNDEAFGHDVGRSNQVKRNNQHVTFNSEKKALEWILENSKGEEMFVRKISKQVNRYVQMD